MLPDTVLLGLIFVCSRLNRPLTTYEEEPLDYGDDIIIDQENKMEDMTMLWNGILTLAIGGFLWWIRGTQQSISTLRRD